MKVFLTVLFEIILNKLGVIQFEGEPENIEIVVNEQTFKISKADYLKAQDDKKLTIKDENVLFFTKADYDTRTKNLETIKYNEGKTAGVEMLAKDLKKTFALEDIEGKDLKVIVETYAERKLKDAKLPKDEKIKEHETTITQLRANLTALETEKNTLTETFTKKEQALQINNTLSLLVPEGAVNENITRSDVIALFRANGYDAMIQEGKIIATKNGEVLKNLRTLEPVELKDVMNNFVTEKNLIKKDGGRGEGDHTGEGAAGTWEAFLKEMEKKGVAQGSAEFQKEMQLRLKNKTLKM